MNRIKTAFAGNRLTARILRSTSWVIVGYGGAQLIRLASNLILTRLLFPEAFGLMALVTVVTVGLMMFSDVGIGPSIAQSKRGDDPAFLDTAWSLQILRGISLFALTLALASPMARFYGQPDLVTYLPMAGLALLVTGFLPTKYETAQRHLHFGVITRIDLGSQLIAVIGMVVLAVLTRSVAALVIGTALAAVAKVILVHLVMDGQRNRFRLEKQALGEQVTFGKWVFLSTAFAFVSMQGDKAILGKLMSLETLGIYNIGFFLASVPMALGLAVNQNILIPIYRDCPPEASEENRRKLQKMRFILTGGIFALLVILAFGGPWIVQLLYDDRYLSAGAMLVLVACGLLAQAVGLSYERAAMAAGDSRGAFFYSGIRSTVQVAALIYGLMQFGLIGGLASLGVAMVLVHPALIVLARKHSAWDPLHDAVFFLFGGVIAAGAIWLHLDRIRALAEIALK